MRLEKMFNLTAKQLMRIIGLTMWMVVLSTFPCQADEITFKRQGIQFGTVLEQDEQTITVRFAKETIKSVVRGQKEVFSGKKTQDPELASTLSQLQKRMTQLEKKLEQNKKTDISASPSPSMKGKTIEQLLRDEMGRVEGVILWGGKPLVNGGVTIAIETYTGFSWASLKKMFSKNKEKSSDQRITLRTQTDSLGRYIFEEAPPGWYRLYLLPNAETGWVRRLAEKPDFEVFAGQLTIHNFPREQK